MAGKNTKTITTRKRISINALNIRIQKINRLKIFQEKKVNTITVSVITITIVTTTIITIISHAKIITNHPAETAVMVMATTTLNLNKR